MTDDLMILTELTETDAEYRYLGNDDFSIVKTALEARIGGNLGCMVKDTPSISWDETSNGDVNDHEVHFDVYMQWVAEEVLEDVIIPEYFATLSPELQTIQIDTLVNHLIDNAELIIVCDPSDGYNFKFREMDAALKKLNAVMYDYRTELDMMSWDDSYN